MGHPIIGFICGAVFSVIAGAPDAAIFLGIVGGFVGYMLDVDQDPDRTRRSANSTTQTKTPEHGPQYTNERQEIRLLASAINRLSHPRSYPSACLIEPYYTRVQQLLGSISHASLKNHLSPADRKKLEQIRLYYQQPFSFRNSAIDTFLQSETTYLTQSFMAIDATALTPEQLQAIVTDDDATLVLASAGSGKTSVITTKATYLIARGIRRPHEILLMAFGKDAASEMAQRVERQCDAQVAAKTFHSLGYEIIRKVEGGAPPVAKSATDNAQLNAMLRDILMTEVNQNNEVAKLVIRWFTYFHYPPRSEWEFRSWHEYCRYIDEQDLRTLQGERVKSFEELYIANWLYLNGIDYEYEPIYEYKVSDEEHRQYTPDFKLTHSGIYIEHFGVRKSVYSDGTVTLLTASYIDRDRYLNNMEWKRQVHAHYGTTLIETYSYERVDGHLVRSLAEKLKPYVTRAPIRREQVFQRLSHLGQIDAFTNTIATFLKHFKGSGLSIDECRSRNGGQNSADRGHAFLRIFETIFEEYQKQITPRVDFEDMIVRASRYVRSGHYESPYRHLLVDEFQDISQGNAELLRALKAQHADTRIFAVGDDWQSIYRFAGSDMRFMRHFGSEFGGRYAGASGVHKTVDLARTFRSVDRIALPARKFVLRNTAQIEKTVVPAGSSASPAIRIGYTEPACSDAALKGVLEDLHPSIEEEDDRTASVLLLGRYQHLCPENLSALQKEHPGLAISFETIHASKGREADHVVILGAKSGRFGFPSEIVDDPILNLVLPEPERFPHAEERRVFYVALTRAKETVTILAPQDAPSPFVLELLEDRQYGVVELNTSHTSVDHECPSCGGHLIPRRSTEGNLRFQCEHARHCGKWQPACLRCGNDRPERSSTRPGTFICSCGADFTACPKCTDGWLVERTGPYGMFLGCINYPDCKGRRNIS